MRKSLATLKKTSLESKESLNQLKKLVSKNIIPLTSILAFFKISKNEILFDKKLKRIGEKSRNLAPLKEAIVIGELAHYIEAQKHIFFNEFLSYRQRKEELNKFKIFLKGFISKNYLILNRKEIVKSREEARVEIFSQYQKTR